MDTALTLIKEAIEALSHIPAHWFYIIGAGTATGIPLSITVAVITYRKKWKDAEKYGKAFIGFILTVLGLLMSLAFYAVTHSSDITNLLSTTYFASIAQYALPAWGTALLVANKIYEFGGSRFYAFIYNKFVPWWNAHLQAKAEAKKSIFKTKLPQPVVRVATSDDDDSDIFKSAQ